MPKKEDKPKQRQLDLPEEKDKKMSFAEAKATVFESINNPKLLSYMAELYGLKDVGPDTVWTTEKFVKANIKAQDEEAINKSQFVWQTIRDLCEEMDGKDEFMVEKSVLEIALEIISKATEEHPYFVLKLFGAWPKGGMEEWKSAQFLSHIAFFLDRDKKESNEEHFDILEWIRKMNFSDLYKEYMFGDRAFD